MTDKIRPQCGTEQGCKLHRRHGEPNCDMCSEAHRERAKEYRARPEVKEHHRVMKRAETRAVARLKKAFPDKYREFFEEEKFRSLIEEFGTQRKPKKGSTNDQ